LKVVLDKSWFVAAMRMPAAVVGCAPIYETETTGTSAVPRNAVFITMV
jgi:hypothetical protein